MSVVMRAEWDSMEERADRCLRIAAVMRHDAMTMCVAELRSKVMERVHQHERRANEITAQLKAARGY